MAATIPVIAAIRGFLKIRIREAKSRIVPARKSGIRVYDRSADGGRVSSPAGLKRMPQIDIIVKASARILSFLESFIPFSLLPLLSSSSRQVSRWRCRGRLGGQ